MFLLTKTYCEVQQSYYPYYKCYHCLINFLSATLKKHVTEKFFSKSLMNILYKAKIVKADSTFLSFNSNEFILYETFLPTICCKAFVDFY